MKTYKQFISECYNVVLEYLQTEGYEINKQELEEGLRRRLAAAGLADADDLGALGAAIAEAGQWAGQVNARYGSTPATATQTSVSGAVDKALADKGTSHSASSEKGKTGITGSGSISYSGTLGNKPKPEKPKPKPEKPKPKPEKPKPPQKQKPPQELQKPKDTTDPAPTEAQPPAKPTTPTPTPTPTPRPQPTGTGTGGETTGPRLTPKTGSGGETIGPPRPTPQPPAAPVRPAPAPVATAPAAPVRPAPAAPVRPAPAAPVRPAPAAPVATAPAAPATPTSQSREELNRQQQQQRDAAARASQASGGSTPLYQR